MIMDKELYRQAYAQRQAWSEAAERERLLAAAQLTPGERWRQLQILFEFCRSFQPEQSPFERAEKLAAIDRFYDAVRELERWRETHGISA